MISQSKQTILIVDDEEDIIEFLSYNLKAEGYNIITATNGVDAITLAKKNAIDLILLDVMMPHKNGIDTCIELRKLPTHKETIIIFLTAMNDETQEIQGLQAGADDYISKPIKPKLLSQRIETALKRIVKQDELAIHFENLIINRTNFSITHKGSNIAMPRKEFELIALLASKPGKVFLRNEILDKVWGNEVIVGDRTIDVHVRKIRQKLNEDYIVTVKGVGYKFESN
jgi:two-component system alkaline phosphatase synthesis response regulator PhoP